MPYALKYTLDIGNDWWNSFIFVCFCGEKVKENCRSNCRRVFASFPYCLLLLFCCFSLQFSFLFFHFLFFSAHKLSGTMLRPLCLLFFFAAGFPHNVCRFYRWKTVESKNKWDCDFVEIIYKKYIDRGHEKSDYLTIYMFVRGSNRN